jgi:hypothetical protein
VTDCGDLSKVIAQVERIKAKATEKGRVGSGKQLHVYSIGNHVEEREREKDYYLLSWVYIHIYIYSCFRIIAWDFGTRISARITMHHHQRRTEERVKYKDEEG